MDEFTKEALAQANLVQPLTLVDISLALAATLVLNLVLAVLYMFTHGGYSYSKSYLHAIVLVGVTVALIMVIIGSDIARAFALVGAMSIVRFRTPVKDTKDLVFLFAAIAIGMACGTGFYEFGAVFVGFVVVIVLGFHYLRFGDLPPTGYVLKLRLNSGERDRLAELCRQLCARFSFVSISRLSDVSEQEEIVCEVKLKRGVKYEELIDRLSKSITPLSVTLLVGEGNVSA